MNAVLQKVNVPDIETYKDCGGWSKDIKGFTDRDEIDMRIDLVKKNVGKDIFELFEILCNDYKKTMWNP
jgi:hypothetical protein